MQSAPRPALGKVLPEVPHSVATLAPVAATVVVTVLIALLTAPAAHGFGTIGEFGQNWEHEWITRGALACPSGPGCFEPATATQLAGAFIYFGAVGAPDIPLPEDFAAHCDDADYLAPQYTGERGYPRSREAASATLFACVAQMRRNFRTAAVEARGILFPGSDVIDPAQVELSRDCLLRLPFTSDYPGDPRAKCRALLGFGRQLHGVQDFYSHSNWADEPHPGPIGPKNPPGLERDDLPDFLEPTSATGGLVLGDQLEDLTTGCWRFSSDIRDTDVPGSHCFRRVRHRFINKDTGLISFMTGHAGNATSPRGEVAENFQAAVTGAMADSRRQWESLRRTILEENPGARGPLIVCALTHDDPVNQCQGRDIAIVIDSSGSNEETDPSNLRIAAGMQLNGELVDAAEADKPGGKPDRSTVVDFDSSAAVISPLDDPSKASFDGIDSDGGTDIGSGVDAAIEELTKDGNEVRDRAGIVVLSDGKDGDPDHLVEALGRARDLGIRVAFGFLSPPEIPVAKQARTASRRPVHGAQASEQPAAVQSAILDTGGVFSTIDSAEAQRTFVDLVRRSGVTNLNDPNGSDDDGAISPELAVTARIATPGDVDRFTYVAPPGRRLTVSVRPLDGSWATLSATSLVDARRLRATKVPSSLASLTITTRRPGPVAFDVSASDGATGLYEIRMAQAGVDVLGTPGPDELKCPPAPAPGVLPPPAYVAAGPDMDSVQCGAAPDVIVGGPGPDVMFGGKGGDTFLVGRRDISRGTETIFGGRGRDTVEFATRRHKVRRSGNVRVVRFGRAKVNLWQIERVEFTGAARVRRGGVPAPGAPGSNF